MVLEAFNEKVSGNKIIYEFVEETEGYIQVVLGTGTYKIDFEADKQMETFTLETSLKTSGATSLIWEKTSKSNCKINKIDFLYSLNFAV